jgi:hypothetical protein
MGGKKFLPHLIISICLVVVSCVPTVSFGATTYLENNADDFVAKTKDTYGEMINIAALLHDYDAKMITAVIVVESEGNEVAVSNKGARGLMQLMPETAKALGVKNPKDPFQNILAGTRYLKELENGYGFASPQEALVAYNMGPARARRWLSQYDSNDYLYVKKVMYVYNLLDQEERAALAQNKIDTAPLATATASASAKPLMTRPRNLALAPFALAIPSGTTDNK